MPGNPARWRPRRAQQSHGEFWEGGTPGKGRLVEAWEGEGWAQVWGCSIREPAQWIGHSDLSASH